MRRIIAMLLAVMLTLSLVPAAAAQTSEEELLAATDEIVVEDAAAEAPAPTGSMPEEPAAEEADVPEEEELSHILDLDNSEKIGQPGEIADLRLRPVPRAETEWLPMDEATEVIKEEMISRDTDFTVYTYGYSSSTLSEEEILAVCDALLLSAMEHDGTPKGGDYLAAHLNTVGYNVGYANEGRYYYFEINYELTYLTTSSRENTVNSRVSSAIKNLNKEELTDYEKICGIYEYLVENVDFDHKGLGNADDTLQHTAYGALYQNSASTMGFAVAFYRMALELGIDCRIVTGGSVIEDQMYYGAWNIVKLNGQYYYVDAALDAIRAEDDLEYAYFLQADAEFADHILDEVYTTTEFKNAYPMSTAPYVEGVYRSGTTGEVSWILYENGTLTIYGEGAMEDYTSSTAVPWYSHRSMVNKIIVEDGVTSIGNYAFYQCSKAAEFSVAETVTDIGNYAFYECTLLSDSPIHSGVTGIGGYAFYGCKELPEVVLPAGITSVGAGTFDGCSNLKSITLPDTLISIGSDAFASSGLETIVIPASVKTLGRNAFQQCYYLKSVTIHAKLTTIESNTFERCGITSISLPDTVTTIGHSAFYLCESLESIDLPDSLTTIEDGAFSGCKALKEITIPKGVTKIPNSLFDDAWSLTNVTFQGEVTDIGSSAFSGCSSLKEIELPDSLTRIGAYAFSGCTALEQIVIPEGVAVIQSCIFLNADSLTSVTFQGAVTEISHGAFQECISLKEIVLPVSLTKIDGYVFYGCTALERVAIPADVGTIGQMAFRSCNLSELIFDGNAPEIDNSAFSDATVTAYYPQKDPTWTEDKLQNYGGTITWVPYAEPIASGTCGENLTWTLTDDGVLTISGSGDMTDYSVEEKAPWNAYKNQITSVVFEEGVTSVGAYAISYCENLTSVTLPGTITEIGRYAFFRCGKLTNVDIPEGVVAIDECAFSVCSLEEVILPNSLKTLGNSAFESNDYTEVTVPAGVTSMGERVFGTQGTLTAIHVDGNNTAYASVDGVLYNKDLTVLIQCPDGYTGKLVIPGSVTRIEQVAFGACGKITSVTIPAGIQSIGDYAFMGCVGSIWSGGSHSGLTEVIFRGNAPEFGYQCFSGSDFTAYYPEGNTTWTEDVLQDYDGDITWESYELHVAQINGVQYKTVEEALNAAVSGDMVTLIADAVENVHLTINEGVTLDLAGYDLTAKSLNGLSGSYLNATRYGNADHGRLFVAKNRLSLTDAVINGQNKVIPYWDPADGCYVLANTRIKDIDGALIIDEEAKTISFKFSYGAGGAANADFLSDGAEDNTLTFVVRLEWESENGIAYQDFVYKNEYVSALANSGGNFTFGLTGYDALSIDLSTFSITGMILSDSGIIVSGEEYTA